MSPVHGPADGGPPASPRSDPVLEALCRIDEETEAFSIATGIRCPDGCGACCHSPHVEACASELGPLASAIVARGDAARTLERLDAAATDGEARCILFEPEGGPGSTRGRCREYARRPSICRGFGFAGRRGPDGEPRFSPCSKHVAQAPDLVASAVAAVHDGRIPLPLLPELASRVRAAAESDAASTTPRPINVALREAIERAALRARLDAAADEPGDDRGDHDGRSPVRPPRRPVRPAA